VDTLLRHADVAMYQSKEAHSGAEIYAAERDENSADRLRLGSELRRAMERRELVLHFQPKVNLVSGETIGLEALVRWQHPDQGLLGPDRFIPFAEQTGLIKPLTRYVLDAALRQCRAWSIQGLELTLAVNLSARDLLDLHLPGEIEKLLARWQVDASRLELEMTENTILTDPMRAQEILGRLKDLGIRIAIDDFGSGFASLGYLKRLPLDVLKIDKSFVLGMEDDEESAAIVRSTIHLAHDLGLQVVAEGVENEAIRQTLMMLGCDAAQGYHFGRPLRTVEVPAWLSDARRRQVAEAPRGPLPVGIAPVASGATA
jgi:EAL domain-containing protein (putative c-di-GMP-specific phosphodiesterase class I)